MQEQCQEYYYRQEHKNPAVMQITPIVQTSRNPSSPHYTDLIIEAQAINKELRPESSAILMYEPSRLLLCKKCHSASFILMRNVKVTYLSYGGGGRGKSRNTLHTWKV